MEALDTAEARGAEIAPPDGAGLQWVHLLPAGRAVARDGRHFDIANPDAIINRFRDGAVDLPVDFEHAIDNRRGSEAVAAAGWIADLERRADGIWAAVRWTDRAAAMIRAREYRYISPSMLYNPKTREVLGLRGAGLVHHPALQLTALASEASTMTDTTDTTAALDRIAEALGLPAGTPLDRLLAAIARLATPDPKRYVPADAVAELLRDRNEQLATMSVQEAERTVELALSRGYLTPAMRDWAIGLCRSDAESFRQLMAKATPAYAGLFQRSHASALPPDSRRQPVDDDASRIAGIIGVKPEDVTRR